MHSIPSTRARTIGVTLSWIAAAAVAIAVGTAAVGALGNGIIETAPQPLTTSEVTDTLAGLTPVPTPTTPAATTPSLTPTPTSTAPPPAGTTDPPPAEPVDPPPVEPADPPPADPPPGESVVTQTAGGTVVSRCADGLVTLVSWPPAQGFAVDQVDPGPTDHANVRFEGGETRVDVDVRCNGDTPDVAVEVDDD